jgi:nucleoside-diphosphate-sugar epimerase
VKALVTGAAGFLGSALSERLLIEGWDVLGVDCFTDAYPRAVKEAHVRPLLDHAAFELLEADLRVRDPRPMVESVDVVFHFAGEPKVDASWDQRFSLYNEHNVLATQRLLDASRGTGLRRFVFASASAVYGSLSQPWSERMTPRPRTPYGATKLAAEHLCTMYHDVHGVPAVSLRYFTVYGPRQRPDMAIHKMIEAAASGTEFTMQGLGLQVRNFTFVDDAVDAAVRAATSERGKGTAMNVGGGSRMMNDVVDLVQQLVEREIQVARVSGGAGEIASTAASFQLAADLLAWTPATSLEVGLQRQAAWQLADRRSAAGGRT